MNLVRTVRLNNRGTDAKRRGLGNRKKKKDCGGRHVQSVTSAALQRSETGEAAAAQAGNGPPVPSVGFTPRHGVTVCIARAALNNRRFH